MRSRVHQSRLTGSTEGGTRVKLGTRTDTVTFCSHLARIITTTGLQTAALLTTVSRQKQSDSTSCPSGVDDTSSSNSHCTTEPHNNVERTTTPSSSSGTALATPVHQASKHRCCSAACLHGHKHDMSCNAHHPCPWSKAAPQLRHICGAWEGAACAGWVPAHQDHLGEREAVVPAWALGRKM